MCCFTQSILTLPLSVGGQTHGRTQQRLQDAFVNVGRSDVRETLWTASCWFALAPQERDEAMMLSQLTFRESESLTEAGAAREKST